MSQDVLVEVEVNSDIELDIDDVSEEELTKIEEDSKVEKNLCKS
jgi:hypothetical protein